MDDVNVMYVCERVCDVVRFARREHFSLMTPVNACAHVCTHTMRSGPSKHNAKSFPMIAAVVKLVRAVLMT